LEIDVLTLLMAVIEMAGKEGKELLGKNTDKALADGAFGLPWFVATNGEGKTETFWGVDHLGQVTAHLGLEKPQIGGWKAML
jgi:2-hydroxychromene-2-carboxylate isomerase